MGRVSAWAKPFRPRYLVVRYLDGGEPATLRVFLDDSAPGWPAAEVGLIDKWYDTLHKVDVLAHRVEPADSTAPPPSPIRSWGTLVACAVVMPLAIAWLAFRLLH